MKASLPRYVGAGVYVRPVPPPVMVTVPCPAAECVTIFSVSPVSGRSESLASTASGVGPAFWCTDNPTSFAALGGSLTGSTVIVNVCSEKFTPPLAVPPLSVRRTVTVASPLRFAPGVNVSVPLEATAGATEKSVAFVSPVMVKPVSDWPVSLAGPTMAPVAQPTTVLAPLSSFTTWLAPLVNAGGSFTAVTVRVTVRLVLFTIPSLAR